VSQVNLCVIQKKVFFTVANNSAFLNEKVWEGCTSKWRRFLYFKQKSPSIGDARGKEGILVSRCIREGSFLELVNLKLQPDTAFKATATDFLGNLTAEN
jgi:hypothetical protein